MYPSLVLRLFIHSISLPWILYKSFRDILTIQKLHVQDLVKNIQIIYQPIFGIYKNVGASNITQYKPCRSIEHLTIDVTFANPLSEFRKQKKILDKQNGNRE